MTKLKSRIITTCFFLFIIIYCFFSFFDSNEFNEKYKEFIHYSKTHVGAVIYNKTGQTLRIADYKFVRKLPSGKSSRDIGVFDTDALIIDQPMYYEDTIHFDGVLKVCDYSRINLVKRDGVIEIEAKNAWICKLLNDFDFYNNIDEAFK